MKTLLTTLLLLITTINYSQTYEEVKSYISDTDSLDHKDIVLRQSVLETGWYKSYTCRVRHNLFGFRYKTWVTEKNPKGYIIFATWKDSVKYYQRWQKRHYKGGNYYDFLTKRGYAKDPKYIKNLKGIKLR